MLLLESRSSLVSWGPYFWSICLRLFLCQVAAGEMVVELDDGGGVVNSLLCGCCCSINCDDGKEGVVSEDEDVISSKVLDGDDLSSVVTCFDLENEPIVVRLDGA